MVGCVRDPSGFRIFSLDPPAGFDGAGLFWSWSGFGRLGMTGFPALLPVVFRGPGGAEFRLDGQMAPVRGGPQAALKSYDQLVSQGH